MKTLELRVANIPAILWGNESERLYIYVHGKMSCKEYAKDFAEIADSKGIQTLSFDLPEHGERICEQYRCDIFNGIYDLSKISEYAFSNWSDVSLFACSLGAFFSLHAYANLPFTKCLFQSPILDMEYLIRQMFQWFQVTEEQLCTAKEISTPVDTLRWDYFQYVISHPITDWNTHTSILYGGKDNMQSIEVIQTFVQAHNCKLTISEDSEHPFMEEKDTNILHKWMEENLLPTPLSL